MVEEGMWNREVLSREQRWKRKLGALLAEKRLVLVVEQRYEQFLQYPSLRQER